MGKKRAWLATGAVAASVLVGVPSQPASATPEGFETSNVITGLDRPTNMEFASDGRLFIAEQGGLLKVFDSIDDSTPDIAADLRDQVHSVNGRGLLGLALDPDFPTTPHVYVMYSHDAPIGGTAPTYGTAGASNDECAVPGTCVIGARISRLVMDGNTATSEAVILEDWCQEYTSHSIGDLRFSPDGSLYATGGDGAFAGQPDWGQKSGANGCDDPPDPHGGTAQDPATAEGGALRSQDLRTSGDPAGLNGTVIRIDKNTGAAHPDNPNAGDPDPNVARVVAYGLRNPYRTAIRPGTEELWLGDVGWNDWEEINVVNDPDNEVPNFGWPCLEGPDVGYDIGANLCTDLIAEGPGAVTPAYWMYKQREAFADDLGCFNSNGSPSALTFYEGGFYPDEHDGAFFFGDYSRRCVWEMFPGSDGRPDPSTVQLIHQDIAVTDLTIGPGGDVFMLNIFGGGGLGGTVVRLQYPDGVAEPIARVTASATEGPAPLTVTLDASTSSPGLPGNELSFNWDIDGDGTFGDASGAVVQATYNDEGRITSQVKVTDATGVDFASQLVIVGTAPVVTITQPITSESWIVGQEIPFAGSAVDSAGEPVAASELSWDLILHHCESLDDCHTHTIGTIEDIASGSFNAPEHEYPTYIEVMLSATSAAGLTGTASVELHPETTLFTVDSAPQGLEVGFNGKPVITPSTHEVVVGTGNTVSANETQFIEPNTFLFNSWDDGGARIHDVTVTEPTTVTALHDVLAVPTLLPENIVAIEPTGSRVKVKVPVRLSSPHTETVRVKATLVAGTATIGSDVVNRNPATITFQPGQTDKTFTVELIGDNIDELDEFVTVQFSEPQNAPLGLDSADISILDDDATPLLTISDKSVLEGNGGGSKSATMVMRLSGRSDRPITVDVETADNTATADLDYEPIEPTTITFDPGRTYRTLQVRIIKDGVAEQDESFFVRVLGADNAIVDDDEGRVTIKDDEPTLKVADVKLIEGATGQRSMKFVIRSSKTAQAPINVDWSTLDQSAETGVDYLGGSGTATIKQGKSSVSVIVKINGDKVPEPDETFLFVLANPNGASLLDGEATGTIRSDDYEPMISIADASKVEGSTSVKLVITLDSPGAKQAVVYLETEDGTATAGDDYVPAVNKRIAFAAGVTRKTVTVKLKHDSIAEGDETFTVRLFNPTAATIDRAEATATIIDND